MLQHQLPREMWVQILGYLDVADKHNVRVTCKYFKELVDCGLLWKYWTIVLSFPKASYTCRFWETLRLRKVNQVVVRSTREKDWEQLSRGLPSVTKVIVDQSSEKILRYLKNFAQLTHLAVRYSSDSLLLNVSTVCEAEKLTHLSICQGKFSLRAINHFFAALTAFRNLTSFVFHEFWDSNHCVMTIPSILCCLPRLKHLSVACGCHVTPTNVLSTFQVEAKHPLSSLELIHLDNSVSIRLADLLLNLQTLVLIDRYFFHSVPSRFFSENLTSWLRRLHQLSTLVIKSGEALTPLNPKPDIACVQIHKVGSSEGRICRLHDVTPCATEFGHKHILVK
ncbi:uncharacterized protein LOC144023844 isoform X2 [Festucalex cinctus]